MTVVETETASFGSLFDGRIVGVLGGTGEVPAPLGLWECSKVRSVRIVGVLEGAGVAPALSDGSGRLCRADPQKTATARSLNWSRSPRRGGGDQLISRPQVAK